MCARRPSRQVGSVEAIKLLLAAGAKVNVQDVNFDTPLSLAIQNRFDDAAICLLDGGADPSVESKSGVSVLYTASKSALQQW